MRLKYNAEPHHRLFLEDPDENPDAEPVHGGQVFDVPDEQAEELLTQPGLDVIEDVDLSTLKRAELDQVAIDRGLDPTDFSTMDALRDVLENPNQQSEADGEGQTSTETETLED